MLKQKPARSIKKAAAKKTNAKAVYRKRSQPMVKASNANEESLRRFSDIVLHVIEDQLATTVFTRDDVLVLMSRVRLDSKHAWTKAAAGVNDSATGTRYRKVCDAIAFLSETRKIIAIGWLKFCVPNAFKTLTDSSPPEVSYLPTIRRLVTAISSGTIIDVMSVVDRWRSDQHLPENIKRMTVRSVLPVLIREKVLKRGEFRHEFIVK